MPPRKAVPEGIRITRLGLAYILVTVLVGIAATNTGNNALYLVLALMLALLAISGVASRDNVRWIEIEVDPPEEIHAGTPFSLSFRLVNASRFMPHWLILFWARDPLEARLVPHLPRRGFSRAELELLYDRRGRHQLPFGHLASIFPLGLFRKGMRYRIDLELLVFPRLLDEVPRVLPRGGRAGEEASRRVGRGHDLLSLRPFRPGDDPRGVHWKQTARSGSMIFTEREAEEGKRLSILCENGVGELDEEGREEFEYLVSEAATAGCRYLERGFEVELVTRDRHVPFAGGRSQRRAILTALADLAPAPTGGPALSGQDPRVPTLRLAMESGERRLAAGSRA